MRSVWFGASAGICSDWPAICAHPQHLPPSPTAPLPSPLQVIFCDSDQVVRADLRELWHMDLEVGGWAGGRVGAYGVG